LADSFLLRFAPGAQILAMSSMEEPLHQAQHFLMPTREIWPEVVIHDPERNRLFLIEVGRPITTRRLVELRSDVLGNSSVAPVFVSAFPDFATFCDVAGEIAWETEVWIADRPTHMIHFNGDRFLGPHGA
jgi:hypothetical protein